MPRKILTEPVKKAIHCCAVKIEYDAKFDGTEAMASFTGVQLMIHSIYHSKQETATTCPEGS